MERVEVVGRWGWGGRGRCLVGFEGNRRVFSIFGGSFI